MYIVERYNRKLSKNNFLAFSKVNVVQISIVTWKQQFIGIVKNMNAKTFTMCMSQSSSLTMHLLKNS